MKGRHFEDIENFSKSLKKSKNRKGTAKSKKCPFQFESRKPRRERLNSALHLRLKKRKVSKHAQDFFMEHSWNGTHRF